VVELTTTSQSAPIVTCNRHPSALLNRTQQFRSEYCSNFFPRVPPSQGKPSEFEELQKSPKLAVLWDRPPSAADSIPNMLLHPILCTFIDDCENLQPMADDNNLVMVSVTMSGFVENETERASKFRQIMRPHAEIELSARTIDGTVPDMPPTATSWSTKACVMQLPKLRMRLGLRRRNHTSKLYTSDQVFRREGQC